MPPLLCACCLSDNPSGSHQLTQFVNLLKKCLNVKVCSSQEESIICNRCVKKLKNLEKFRSQVKSSQNFFKQLKTSEPEEDKSHVTPEVLLQAAVPGLPVNLPVIPVVPTASADSNPPDESPSYVTYNLASVSLEQKLVKKSKGKSRETLPYKLDSNSRTCPLCRQHFTFFKELTNHMPSHFPDHICHTCGKLCATKLSLHNHLKTHSAAAHECATCGKVYKKKSILKDHIKFKHLGKVKKYNCRDCKEQFDTYHGRLIHSVQAHGCEDKKYKCSECAKRFNHSSHLHAHTRSEHRNERNVSCDICAARFVSKSALKKHSICHTTEKKHKCLQCGKTYPRRSSLKQHLKIHSNSKAYVCSVCGRAFTQKITLKKHALTHKPEKTQDAVNNLSSMLQNL